MKKHYYHGMLFPFILVIYEISMYLSNDMYLPALPQMMHDLSLTSAHAQLTITMWFLGSAMMPLFMGALADRFGRRNTLLIGGILYVLSGVLCALAINEYTLLIPRIVQGAMISSMMVAGYACIHELYAQKDAIRVLAIMGSISVLAPALGPLLGAVLLLFASWRWIFWFIALLAAAMLVLLFYYMPESLPVAERQPLHFKAIARNYKAVLFNRRFILLMLVLGLNFLGFIGWVTTGPLLVIDSLKYSAIAFGWMQAIVFGAFIVGSHYVNVLMEKHSAISIINIALGICLISGIALWLVAGIWPDHFYFFLAAITVFSFGSAIAFAPLNRLIIETSSLPMGIRVAMFTTGLMGSGALGSGIASFVYNGTPVSLASIIGITIILACLLHLIYLITIVIPSRIC